MSLIGLEKLLRPETLPETILIENLKNICIELEKLKNMKKTELMEMYRKFLLPLPQRRYNESKCFGKRLSDLRLSRRICVAIDNDQKAYESVTSLEKANNSAQNCDQKPVSQISVDNNFNKPQSTNPTFVNQKVLSENGFKRKNDDRHTSPQVEVRKRQKITWP